MSIETSNRRQFVTDLGRGLGVSLALSSLGSAAFADEAAPAKAPEKKSKRRPLSHDLQVVIASALDCIKTGNICLSHCQSKLANGDTSLADCQVTVMNLIAVTDTLAKIASYNNADEAKIKAYAKLCAGFCADCAKECEVHVSHHAECKNCFNSCKACISACEKYTA